MFTYNLAMPARVRRSGTERRGEIAAAALRLLGMGGLAAVTSASVAAEVGVSPAALFRHFPTLPAIVEAAVELAIARLDATRPPADGPALPRLRALAHARVRLFEEIPGVAWLLRSEQAYASLPASAVAGLRGAIGRSRKFIHAAIREGVEAGELRADVAPRVLLIVFTATVHALATPTGIAQRSVGRLDADDVLPDLFRLLRVPEKEPPR